MSMFYCAECDNLADADDGCEEDASGLRLICVDCASECEECVPFNTTVSASEGSNRQADQSVRVGQTLPTPVSLKDIKHQGEVS